MKKRMKGLLAAWVAFLMLLSIPGVSLAADYADVYVAENGGISLGVTTEIGGWLYSWMDLDSYGNMRDSLTSAGATTDADTWRVWLGGRAGHSSGAAEVKADVGLISAEEMPSKLRTLSDTYADTWEFYILEPVSRSGGGSPLPSYEVKFLDYDGNVFETKYIQQNATLVHRIPEKNPTVKDFTFTQWYMDEALTEPLDPSVRIKQDTVLYSGWEAYVPPVFTAPEGGTDVSDMGDVSNIKDNQIVITIGADTMMVYGRSVPLDAPAYMQDGIPMLPVRAVLEQIGMKGANLFTWSEAEMDALLLHSAMGDYKIASGSDMAYGVNTQLKLITAAKKVDYRFFIPYDALGRLYSISAKWNGHSDVNTVVLTVDTKVYPKY
ncbi:MAG: hypothetical protein IJD83_03935 [Clostridia bacterium]|nr:hypothetical protein [Clostridia bacterium]